MEGSEMPNQSSGSIVDTSRPFRSVKEAVAVFGERLLVGDAYSSLPKPSADVPLPELGTWESLPSSTTTAKEEKEHVLDSLKKLEAELEETKEELRLLKEKEEDTEVALASLNAELHKNMSKLAEAEAAAAAKAVATRRIAMGCESERKEEEMKRSEFKMMRMEETESPTLAQILSFGDKIGYFGGKKEKKKIKKKPIIPLVGDLLFIFRKKGSPENALPSSFNSFN
ncbi:WEB family protein At1g75720 [Benincasa hispida]|uniref:WEB family protein At1g75720 n=1 Tax=Benincasa hispida TaxID=102211 RepID=UPI0019019CF8|nr:WEB family protein At1g75720 [Benincasa hispida]